MSESPSRSRTGCCLDSEKNVGQEEGEKGTTHASTLLGGGSSERPKQSWRTQGPVNDGGLGYRPQGPAWVGCRGLVPILRPLFWWHPVIVNKQRNQQTHNPGRACEHCVNTGIPFFQVSGV